MTSLSVAGSALRGNSPEATIGRFRRWKADRHNPLISESVRGCRASEHDPLPPVQAFQAPRDPDRASPPPIAHDLTCTRRPVGADRLRRQHREKRQPRPRIQDYRQGFGGSHSYS